jgi:hypothetical protein
MIADLDKKLENMTSPYIADIIKKKGEDLPSKVHTENKSSAREPSIDQNSSAAVNASSYLANIRNKSQSKI